MPDLLAEMKAALERQVERQIRQGLAQRAITPGPPGVGSENPFGAGPNGVLIEGFGTGYDGAETVLPFTWGISVWGESDVWTG